MILSRLLLTFAINCLGSHVAFVDNVDGGSIAAEVNICTPPGTAPLFELGLPKVSASDNSLHRKIIVSTFKGIPSFSGTFTFLTQNSPPVRVEFDRSKKTELAERLLFQETVPALEALKLYRISLGITLYTNLSEQCQKHFFIDLGTLQINADGSFTVQAVGPDGLMRSTPMPGLTPLLSRKGLLR